MTGRLPQICTVGPQRGGSDSEPIQNHCFSNIQTISGAVIDCDAKFDCTDDNAVPINQRMWFINGVLQTGQDRFLIPISQPGTYTCVVNHTCGIIQSRVASVPRGKFKQVFKEILYLIYRSSCYYYWYFYCFESLGACDCWKYGLS